MPVTRRPYRTFGMREGHPAPPPMPHRPLNPGAEALQGRRALAAAKAWVSGQIARAGGSATRSPYQRALDASFMNTPWRRPSQSDVGQANPPGPGQRGYRAGMPR